MPIRRSKHFKESALAHQLLDGLTGLQIGGSAHNDFGLDTLNVDYSDDMDTTFKKEEIEYCGETLPVDIVANGDNVPVPDKSFDFIVSSHNVEHFFDPIKAMKEWIRIARKYVYIICPQPDADPTDVGKPVTGLEELERRHAGDIPFPEVDDHRHWTRWTCETFREMCAFYGWHVSHWQDPDDKVGNGFTIVIDVDPEKLQTGSLEDGLAAFKAGNYEAAFAAFSKAAVQGHAGAQANLGNLYAGGAGVPQDYRQAVIWYRRAAEQGVPEAQYNLGLLYDSGEGVPQDDSEAMKWYREAAERGHARAQYNLGLCTTAARACRAISCRR